MAKEVLSTNAIICICVPSQALLVFKVSFGNNVRLSESRVNKWLVMSKVAGTLSKLILIGCIGIIDLLLLISCVV